MRVLTHLRSCSVLATAVRASRSFERLCILVSQSKYGTAEWGLGTIEGRWFTKHGLVHASA